MTKYRNIRVKMKGGKTRIQRAMVLASGKLRFVKGKGRKRRSSPKRRRAPKRRRSVRRTRPRQVRRRRAPRRRQTRRRRLGRKIKRSYRSGGTTFG